jgi:hypothetical protein
MRVGWTVIILSVFVGMPWAHANPRFDLMPGSRFTSAPAGAIGDAYFTFVSDVGDSLFINPAGLGELRTKRIEPINIGMGLNYGLLSNFGLGVFQFFSLPSFAASLQGTQSMSFSVYPNFGFRFSVFTVAFGGLLQGRLQGTRLETGEVRNRTRYELAPTLGLGVRIAGGILRLGYSVAWVNRVDGTVDSAAPGAWTDGLSQGSALSHNAAVALTMPWKTLPSLSFVIRNLLGTQYGSIPLHILPLASGNQAEPGVEPMSMDVGFSIQPKFGRGTFLRLGLAYRDLTNASQTSLQNHFSLGGEFTFRDRVSFRLGLSGTEPQLGWIAPSAGVGFNVGAGMIDVAYYPEQIGALEAPIRDQRFQLQFRLGF